MRLPTLEDPHKYGGLYVYDFGDHASVGYTAGEIRALLESQRFGGGTAYEIYRVNEEGGLELRGATRQRLSAIEAMCFLRHEGADARRDYELIRQRAIDYPIGAAVELQLARAYEFKPSDVTAMLYPIAAAAVVAAWLQQLSPLGDAVEGGEEAGARYIRSSGMRVASCALCSTLDYTDRPLEALAAAFDRPCQR